MKKDPTVYTWESGAGLGWVAAASGSVICPDLHWNYELPLRLSVIGHRSLRSSVRPIRLSST
jgi:hypothetical protein